MGATSSRNTPPETADRHSTGSHGAPAKTSPSPSTAPAGRGFYRSSPGFKGRLGQVIKSFRSTARGPHPVFTTNQQEEEKYRNVVARKDAAVNKRRPLGIRDLAPNLASEVERQDGRRVRASNPLCAAMCRTSGLRHPLRDRFSAIFLADHRKSHREKQ